MLIRQSAFDGKNRLLKGGLHCHTTRSDGKGSPEEVIRLHVKNGYDFLAITDHRNYNFKNFAPEAKITIVPGMEFDSTFEKGPGFRCFHTVSIGPDDGTNGFSQDETFPSGVSSNQDEYQKYLDWMHGKNNLTIYCHPQWSSTPTRYFERLRGNFALEVWNSGCAMECDMDTNAACWDELLGMGQRIYGVATDDGHHMDQHCRGWVMVNAENNVKDILRALSEGSFYASCGPVIRDFTVEDGVAHLTAEPCSRILFQSDRHPSRGRMGDGITEASYNLKGDYSYVRASVTDAQGRRAWTNPIFLD